MINDITLIMTIRNVIIIITNAAYPKDFLKSLYSLDTSVTLKGHTCFILTSLDFLHLFKSY